MSQPFEIKCNEYFFQNILTILTAIVIVAVAIVAAVVLDSNMIFKGNAMKGITLLNDYQNSLPTYLQLNTSLFIKILLSVLFTK